MWGKQNITGGGILTMGTCEFWTHDLQRVKQILASVTEISVIWTGDHDLPGIVF